MPPFQSEKTVLLFQMSKVQTHTGSCAQSCPTLYNPVDCSPAPLSMGFSKQEYWSGLPFPSPGDLPDPRIKPVSPAAPALAGGFFTTEPLEKPKDTHG